MEKGIPRQTTTVSRFPIQTKLGKSTVIDMLGLEDGPTLVIVGGHHGNEPAGFTAAGILGSQARPKIGRLVFIPQASPSACELFSRYYPQAEDERESENDLNRCYQLGEGHRYAKCSGAVHAAEIFKVVTSYKPDAVLDLHETSEGHRDCPPGVSIWSYAAGENSELLARKMGIMAIRRDLEHTFTTELTRVGYLALAIETRKGKMLAERVRAHISAVRAAATAIGVKFEIEANAIQSILGED